MVNTPDVKVLKTIDSRKSNQLLKLVKIKTIRGHHKLKELTRIKRLMINSSAIKIHYIVFVYCHSCLKTWVRFCAGKVFQSNCYFCQPLLISPHFRSKGVMPLLADPELDRA